MLGWASAATASASCSKRVREVGSLAKSLGKAFDCHLTVEARVTGTINLAHAARTNRRNDLIPAQPRSGSEVHGVNRFYPT